MLFVYIWYIELFICSYQETYHFWAPTKVVFARLTIVIGTVLGFLLRCDIHGSSMLKLLKHVWESSSSLQKKEHSNMLTIIFRKCFTIFTMMCLLFPHKMALFSVSPRTGTSFDPAWAWCDSAACVTRLCAAWTNTSWQRLCGYVLWWVNEYWMVA